MREVISYQILKWEKGRFYLHWTIFGGLMREVISYQILKWEKGRFYLHWTIFKKILVI